MVPTGVGTWAVLVAATGAMTMPLNRIARYIGEGPENNTHVGCGRLPFAPTSFLPQDDFGSG
jgi:hypothetical protein